MSGSRHKPTLGERRATEDFENIGGFTPEDSKQLAGALIEALRPMAEVEKAHGRARLEIVQWREFGDDEDSLSVEAFPAGSEVDVIQCIADDHQLNCDYDEEHPDQKGNMLVINRSTFYDGEIVTTEGCRFRINIAEVKE